MFSNCNCEAKVVNKQYKSLKQKEILSENKNPHLPADHPPCILIEDLDGV